MNRLATGLSITAAFVAGCGATYLLGPALAAESITAQIIHTGEMEGDARPDGAAADDDDVGLTRETTVGHRRTRLRARKRTLAGRSARRRMR